MCPFCPPLGPALFFLSIVSEGWAGSSENTMKLHTIDGLIQVGYAKQRPTVIKGAVCDYLNLHFLSIPYLSSSFSPLPLPETVGNPLKHCAIGPLNSSIPSWKQFIRLRCRGTFGTGAFPILTTDRQVPAVLAVGAVHFFLPVYAPGNHRQNTKEGHSDCTRDWNAKIGKDAQADWGEVCGPYCNVETNERGLRLLEFATFNNLVLTNTLGPPKPPRRWSWHSPDGKHHDQIHYILVKKRFRSGVNIHRTRIFPGADIGTDHDLVMMTFQVRLKKTRKPNQPRLRFDLEKLRDPDVACTF